MSPTLLWKRSLSEVPYPKVWVEFTQKLSKTSDKLVKYNIQDLPEERIEEAIAHMTKCYLRDEPFSEAAGKNFWTK